MAQSVTLVLTFLLPPEPPARFDLADIAAALRSTDAARGGLRREVVASAPEAEGRGWLTSGSSQADLAHRLGARPDAVRLAFYTPLPFAGPVGPPTPIPADLDLGSATSRPSSPDPFLKPATLLVWRDGTGSAQTSSKVSDGEEAGPQMRLIQVAPGGGIPGGPLLGRPGGGFPGGGLPGGGFPGGGLPGARMPGSPGGGLPVAGLPGGGLQRGGMTSGRLGGLPSATAKSAAQGMPGAPTAARTDSTVANGAAATTPETAIGGRPSPSQFATAPSPAEPAGRGPLSTAEASRPSLGGSPVGGLPERIPVHPQRQIVSKLPAAALPPEMRSIDPPAAVFEPRAQAPTAPGSVSASPDEQDMPAREAPSPTDATAAQPGTPSHGGVQGFIDRARGLIGLGPSPFVQGDFVAGLRLDDGTWAVVRPSPRFLSDWQKRVALWFAVSLAIVAPFGWLFARRLSQPLGRFAEAAAQLGRDLSAAIAPLDGPAEIGRAAHAFNLMQTRLRSFVDDRTAMVGAISHDLRTPLTRLRFRVEDVDDDVRDGMLQDVQEMESMIGSVLSFIRDASTHGARERVDLRTLLDDVADDAAVIGAQVPIVANHAATVEVEVMGMRRVLSNLLENALKYGGHARIELSLSSQEAIAAIIDDGPGVPDEELEQVFQPFYRSAAARLSDAPGSGLGLAVCRSIARAHGGDVRLCRTDAGFRAEVRVPLVYAAQHAMAA